jgi:hypothetical protein
LTGICSALGFWLGVSALSFFESMKNILHCLTSMFKHNKHNNRQNFDRTGRVQIIRTRRH